MLLSCVGLLFSTGVVATDGDAGGMAQPSYVHADKGKPVPGGPLAGRLP